MPPFFLVSVVSGVSPFFLPVSVAVAITPTILGEQIMGKKGYKTPVFLPGTASAAV
jgi:hypothetical protein